MFSKINQFLKNPEAFTSSLLLFVTFTVFQIGWLAQSFKNNYDKYSIILAAASLLFLFKSYIYSFRSLQEVINLKKSFLVFLDIIFFASQIWLIFIAIQSLTQLAYPFTALFCLAIASTTFYIQSFALPTRQLGKSALYATIFYWVTTALLYQTEWINYNQQTYFLFIHFTAITVFAAELWLFFRSTKITKVN